MRNAGRFLTLLTSAAVSVLTLLNPIHKSLAETPDRRIPERPVAVISIPPLPAPLPLPSSLFIYSQDANGRPVLTTASPLSGDFFDQWRDAAHKIISRPGNSVAALLKNEKFTTYKGWEFTLQRDYYEKVRSMYAAMPPECHDNFQLCPLDGEYRISAERLHAAYQASDALHLWQFNHIKTAYVNAIMDEDVRHAALNWGGLRANQKMDAIRKLVGYEAQAFSDMPSNLGLPKVYADELPKVEGAHYSPTDNEIVWQRSSLGVSAAWNFAASWHETAHYLQRLMDLAMMLPEGSRYLENNNLTNEVRINGIADKMYERAGLESQVGLGSLGKDRIYEKQSIEAGVRMAEALGRELANEIRSKGGDFHWTREEAEASFDRAVAAATLDATYGPYANVGHWHETLPYEQGMHEAFLDTYRKGGKVCKTEALTGQLACYVLR